MGPGGEGVTEEQTAPAHLGVEQGDELGLAGCLGCGSRIVERTHRLAVAAGLDVADGEQRFDPGMLAGIVREGGRW
jgi:hypothetical protein